MLNLFKNLKIFNLILSIFLIFYSQNIFSQNKQNNITITGKITDEQKKPIGNVYILDVKTRKTVITDKNGTFIIIIPKNATTLKISHIGYKPYRLDISKKYLKKDTISFNIILEAEVYTIQPVEVYSERVNFAYDNYKANIYDYEFTGDNILLYLFENQTKKLRIVDNSDSILSDFKIPVDFENFYKDCFGNIHLISEDSAYQIYIDTALYLIDKTSIDTFNTNLKPCILSINEDLIFQKYQYYNQYLTYFMINKTNKNKKILTVIHDNKGEALFNMYYKSVMEYKLFSSNGPPEMQDISFSDVMDSNNAYDAMTNINDLKVRTWFFEKIITTPIYAPLFLISDTLFLFDHLNNFLLIYNIKGELITKHEISYNKQDGWAKELIMDYDNERIFAKFCTSTGLTSLKQLDIHTGKIIKEYNLEVHRYPRNIKIKGNFVYYISENPKDFSLDYLYKQPLE